MKDNNDYNRYLKYFAKDLRNNSTKAEIRLWCELLRNKNMMRYSFLRQRSAGNYIADFMCFKLKLIIEVDGITHENKIDADRIRDENLKTGSYFVMRFTDYEIMEELEEVKEKIEKWILLNSQSDSE
jgi:very-short-patch-repair endonuclease